MTDGSGAVDASEARAFALDAADPLTALRDRFRLPTGLDGRAVAYLAGQSLGAQPASAAAAVEAQLAAWATLGVDGHFSPDGWAELDTGLRVSTARLVGARPEEIATLASLTVDLHLLLASFYRPSGKRTTILMDAPTFPSDHYAVDSHLRLRGRDPMADLVVVRPRLGSMIFEPEELEAAIIEQGDRLAVALLAGTNYATGQVHDVARLTEAIHGVGALAIWDLAHSVGNVPVDLAGARVDAAAWCTYKYLNSGPGAPAQIFVARRHAEDPATPRLAGWWGNANATRFEMTEVFRPERDANGWRVSNPSSLALAPIAASLAVFDEVGMPALRMRSVRLTAYLEELLDALVPELRIVTPRDPDRRGAQISVRGPDARARQERLTHAGVITDFREPDIIRLAPVPSYNTYHDAWLAATELRATRRA